MFTDVTFEIFGKCNANCQYCVSGKNSISGSFQKNNSSFIKVEDFKAAINYMLDNEIINLNSTIGLFNWGEPFLHPDFKEILFFLNEKGLRYTLSTNGSKLIEFEKFDLSNLKNIIFSMPGFSQESYDLVHGFKFERIKSNIKKMLSNYRNNGFVGEAVIALHKYRFNEHEVVLAKEFTAELAELNLDLHASAALLNGTAMFKSYLSGKYDEEKVESIELQLYTSFYKQLQSQRPKEYICPQFRRLVLDESCNVITCCGVDKTFYSQALIGNLFELNFEQIKNRKTNMIICSDCQSLGMDYIGHNTVASQYQMEPESYKVSFIGSSKEVSGGRVFLYGSGDIADTFIYQNKTLLSNRFEIVGIMDGNLCKQNEGYNGFVIDLPENSQLSDGDMVLIASQDESSIKAMVKNLTEKLNITNPILQIIRK